MKEYESLLLFTPEIEEAALDSLVEKISGIITKNKGEILQIEKWGKRPLAYEIEKHSRAYYILLNFKSEPLHIKALERQYKLSEPIIRFLTISRETTGASTPLENTQ